MATPNRIEGNMQINGSLTVLNGIIGQNRSGLVQDEFMPFPLELQNFRVWDAFQTLLGTPGSDDLGITAGVYGTGCPYISTGDVKAAGAVTRYARTLFTLPAEYDEGQSVAIALAAGMITTIADVSATVDIQVFKSGDNGLVSGSDLCTTSAQSINSLTFAELIFLVTGSGLTRGSVLDIRLTVSSNDAASATAVIGAIALARVEVDIKG